MSKDSIMIYTTDLNLGDKTLSLMKEAETCLPYIYSFFAFADRQNNIECAIKPLSAKGEKYKASKEQQEIIEALTSTLKEFEEYYGDGEYEKYFSSSFNYYLEKYNAPGSLQVRLPSPLKYTERAASLVRSISTLLYSYALFKKNKNEKIVRGIDSLISMKSYFPAKYYVPVEGKLDEENRLLFTKEMKIRRKNSFNGPHNAAVIGKHEIRRSEIRTTEILDSLFQYGLVEENEKGFLALTRKSELLSEINSYGVIYFRDIKRKGMENALLSLRDEGCVEESGMFFSPDERALLSYVLGSGYENSLSLFSYYTTEKRKDEEKAESDYLLLLSIMTAIMLKVLEEISIIPQTVVKSLKNRKSK